MIAQTPTDILIDQFAEALKAKLNAARDKYMYHGEPWANPNWRDQCASQLAAHIEKGDPLDVAAYCAFMWHHKWPTKAATHRTPIKRIKASDHERYLCDIMVDALQAENAEFTEDEIKRAASLMIGAILVVIFGHEAQHIN